MYLFIFYGYHFYVLICKYFGPSVSPLLCITVRSYSGVRCVIKQALLIGHYACSTVSVRPA